MMKQRILALAFTLCFLVIIVACQKADYTSMVEQSDDRETISLQEKENATEKQELKETVEIEEEKELKITIYDIEEGYLEVDYNPNLPHHTYQWTNIDLIDGYKYYTYEDGSLSTFGIDVSKYQGDINWHLVKEAGVEFVIIRMGYRGYGNGKLVVDEKFHQNIKGATEAGLMVGVYIFSQAINNMEAIEEARFVYENIKDYNLTYPIIFDTEEIKNDYWRTEGLSVKELTELTIAFCQEIESYGYKPMIYANAKWLTTKLNLEELTPYEIWYADYQEEPLYPYQFTMWQYSETGSVPGIEGDVDLNIYFE